MPISWIPPILSPLTFPERTLAHTRTHTCCEKTVRSSTSHAASAAVASKAVAGQGSLSLTLSFVSFFGSPLSLLIQDSVRKRFPDHQVVLCTHCTLLYTLSLSHCCSALPPAALSLVLCFIEKARQRSSSVTWPLEATVGGADRCLLSWCRCLSSRTLLQ